MKPLVASIDHFCLVCHVPESENQAEHSDDEGSCEGKPPTPYCGHSHGLVEAQHAHSQVEQQQQGLGLCVKAVNGSTDCY